MEQFSKEFSRVQPQVVSLILMTILLIIISLVIYYKVKKAKLNQTSKGIAFLAEQYVMGVDRFFKSIIGKDKIQPIAPYIFTLMTFMIMANLIGIIGFEPPTTSYSVPFILGMVAWMGIYVVGIVYKKIAFLKRYLNPLELVTQFTPLISISFRLFGNMIAGTTIMYFIYYGTGVIWAKVPYLNQLNFFVVLIAPPFHLYFDIFNGLIQAYVFTLLVTSYWAFETHQESGQKISIDHKVIAFAKSKGKIGQ